MFDGKVAAGPVPIFSCLDHQEDKKRLSEAAKAIHSDIQLICSSIVRPETVTLDAALKMLKKPRAGKGEASFLRASPSEDTLRPPKRPRLDPPKQPGRYYPPPSCWRRERQKQVQPDSA